MDETDEARIRQVKREFILYPAYTLSSFLSFLSPGSFLFHTHSNILVGKLTIFGSL